MSWTYMDEFEGESDANIHLNDAVYNSHMNTMLLLYINKVTSKAIIAI